MKLYILKDSGNWLYQLRDVGPDFPNRPLGGRQICEINQTGQDPLAVGSLLANAAALRELLTDALAGGVAWQRPAEDLLRSIDNPRPVVVDISRKDEDE